MSGERWEWSVRYGAFGGIGLASWVSLLGTGWWTIALIVISFAMCGFCLFKAIIAHEQATSNAQ